MLRKMNIKQNLDWLIFGAILPSLLNFFIYFGFISNNSQKAFTADVFFDLHKNGVFQYRILSVELLREFHELIKSLELHKFVHAKAVNQLPDQGLFYTSLFIFNYFFFLASGILLFRFLQNSISDKKTGYLLFWLIISLISFSQFIPYAYDTSSYFFLILSIICSYKIIREKEIVRKFYFSFVVFLTVLIAATINRESSALHLSFLATLVFQSTSFAKIHQIKKSLILIGIPTLIFLITYFSLRFFIGNQSNLNVYNRITMLENFFAIKNLVGLLFGVILMYFIYQVSRLEKRKLVVWFCVFSIPYLLIILLVGQLFEIRLFIPILIGAAIIGHIDYRNIKV